VEDVNVTFESAADLAGREGLLVFKNRNY
jgi:hypothetical protein